MDLVKVGEAGVKKRNAMNWVILKINWRTASLKAFSKEMDGIWGQASCKNTRRQDT